jgi:hypothetical protein
MHASSTATLNNSTVPKMSTMSTFVPSSGPSEAIQKTHSLSSKSSTLSETKSWKETDDDDNIDDLIADVAGSSAINFSKFMNKSSAEKKEMHMGDHDDHNAVDYEKFGQIKRLSASKEEKSTPFSLAESKSSSTGKNNVTHSSLDDDDDLEFLSKGKTATSPNQNRPLPPIPRSRSRDEQVRDLISREKSESSEDVSDDYDDDYEEVKYKAKKPSLPAVPVKSAEVKSEDDRSPESKTVARSRSEEKEENSVPLKNEKKEEFHQETDDDEVVEEVDELDEPVEEEEDEEEDESRIQAVKEVTKPIASSPELKSSPVSPKEQTVSSPPDLESLAARVTSSSVRTLQPLPSGRNDVKAESLPPVLGKKPSSTLGALPELKVSNRFGNVSISELLPTESKNDIEIGKKSTADDKESGPEVSSDEEEEEDYSQLDQEISKDIENLNKSMEKSFESSKDASEMKGGNVNSKIVQSKYEDNSSSSNRANVSRLSQVSYSSVMTTHCHLLPIFFFCFILLFIAVVVVWNYSLHTWME